MFEVRSEETSLSAGPTEVAVEVLVEGENTLDHSTNINSAWGVPLDADDVTTWLAQAAHPENVDSVLRVFPEAWDGALNYQMSLGNMARGFFDTGPLFITYDKKIGWVPSE